MKPGRVILLVLGSFLALIGFGLFAGGATLGWALSTQRDDGFFTTSEQRFTTDSFAITSDDIRLGSPGRDDWWADRELATARITADAAADADIFVGIGPDAAVEAYLAGVPHDEVVDIEYRPFVVEYRREHAQGAATPASPLEQDFWVASASGTGTQVLTWDLEPGRWAVVVMNTDASAGVAADMEFGARIDLLVAIAIALGVLGVLLLGGGTVMIVVGATGTRATAVGAPTIPAVTPGTYPLRLDGHLDPDLSRWQWLVKWFLAIPHFIVLVFLWVAFVVVTFVAFFAILFTGRYPRSMFDFNVGVMRWTWRVTFYATSALGTDRYPPFSLAPADYPAELEIEYPERLSHGLVLVKSWLLAIPHLMIVAALSAGWTFTGDSDTGFIVFAGLLGLLVTVAVIGLLFTGRYPQGLFDLIMGIQRWSYRVGAYVALMTDEYPPFRLDQGGRDPGTPEQAIPAAEPFPPPSVEHLSG